MTSSRRSRKNGVSVEYLVFPDEGHGFTKRRNLLEGWAGFWNSSTGT